MSPIQVIVAAVGFVLFCNVIVSLLAITAPYVGLRVAENPSGPGVVIVQVATQSPALQAGLAAGDTLITVRSDARSIAMDVEFFSRDQDLLSSWDAVDRFIQNNAFLFQAKPPFTFTFANREPVEIQPSPGKPLLALLLDPRFTVPLLLGNFVFIVGILIWVFKRTVFSTNLLLGSALACSAMMWTVAPMWSRDFAMSALALKTLFTINYVGFLCYPTFFLCLLLVYPTRLVSDSVLLAMAGGIVLFLLNSWLRIIPMPWRTVSWLQGATCVFGLVAIARQWRHSRNKPVERVQAILVSYSVLFAIFALLVFFMVPVLLQDESVFDELWVVAILSVLPFFGFAIGVARYRLFDLPAWWFSATVWLLSGALIIFVDLILIIGFGIHQITGLTIAIIAVGWIYFPVRQWVLKRFYRPHAREADVILPAYITKLAEARDFRDFRRIQIDHVQAIFQPRAFNLIPGESSDVYLEDNGLALIAPTLGNGEAMRLEAADGGARLFNTADVQLMRSIQDLTQRYSAQIGAIKTEVQKERTRIARDLHDTVGARLVSLLHLSPTPEFTTRARAVTGALKDTIWLLRENELEPLSLACSKWSEETRMRTDEAEIALLWNQGEFQPVLITPHAAVNAGNILRESVSNMLRHSTATRLDVSIKLMEDGALRVDLGHDGVSHPPDDWTPGFGINGMRARAHELGGDIVWQLDAKRDDAIVVKLIVPRSGFEYEKDAHR